MSGGVLGARRPNVGTCVRSYDSFEDAIVVRS